MHGHGCCCRGGVRRCPQGNDGHWRRRRRRRPGSRLHAAPSGRGGYGGGCWRACRAQEAGRGPNGHGSCGGKPGRLRRDKKRQREPSRERPPPYRRKGSRVGAVVGLRRNVLRRGWRLDRRAGGKRRGWRLHRRPSRPTAACHHRWLLRRQRRQPAVAPQGGEQRAPQQPEGGWAGHPCPRAARAAAAGSYQRRAPPRRCPTAARGCWRPPARRRHATSARARRPRPPVVGEKVRR